MKHQIQFNANGVWVRTTLTSFHSVDGAFTYMKELQSLNQWVGADKNENWRVVAENNPLYIKSAYASHDIGEIGQ